MAMLGAALRAELVDALGLRSLRKEFRAECRELAREISSLRAMVERALAHSGSGQESSPGSDGAVSGKRIRAARQQLGESRKAFAARLGVSPGIVFAWESGRSTPRRKAIIIRLQRLLATQAPPTRKRVLKLTTKRRTALKLQGQYMGQLRSLSATQKAQVKKVKAARGFPAAIKLAKKLRRT